MSAPMIAAAVGMMVCCSSSVAAMMMGGDGDKAKITSETKTLPDDSDSGAATPSMLKCLDTRKRLEKGWTTHPRAVHTEAEARALCTGKKYMSFECPNADGYDLWCADDISDMPVLDDAECMGTQSVVGDLPDAPGCDAGGESYLTTEGINKGGWHRGSLYAI
jgi:hypothetical protein